MECVCLFGGNILLFIFLVGLHKHHGKSIQIQSPTVLRYVHFQFNKQLYGTILQHSINNIYKLSMTYHKLQLQM